MNASLFPARAIVFVLAIASSAQAQTAVWTHTWPTSDHQVSRILQDSRGEFVIEGRLISPTQQPTAQFLEKLSSGGQLMWSVAPSLPHMEQICVDAQDDIVRVEDIQPGTLRFEKRSGSNGSVVWTTSHIEPSATGVFVLKLATSSNGDITCLAVYETGQPPNLTHHTTIVRLDAAGQPLWDTFSQALPQSYTVWNLLEVDALGGTSYVERINATDTLVRVDAQGQIVWTRTFSDPRGANDSIPALTVDATGTSHWYVSLQPSSPAPLPCVEVVTDVNGNPLGTHDLPMDAHGGFERAGHRVALGGQSVSSNLAIIESRDEAGHVLWSDSFPSPFGYGSAAAQISMDISGGVRAVMSWYTTVGLVGEQVRSYDSSGHLQWIDGPGQQPIAPAGSEIGVTPYNRTAPETVTLYALVASGFCFGDGSWTACPCGNSSAPSQQAGCAHSLGTGASLAGSGNPSLSNDALSFAVQGATGSALLIAQGSTFQANGDGIPFGDGLRCIGGTIVRIATRPLASGALQYPQPGDLSIAVRGAVTSPGTRAYQGFFRNNAAFCTPSTQNSTNGVFVHWLP